ncbi:DUF2157 domain-containing protein [Chitinophaga rhizosphaerae]|uniref:DUF2157 domain-containing protein n=1 Tax=Chitinophaga rhizosphaerae TaxID=1864947 RepID=UPI000F80B5A7|nr:DUF2157 domain-containing protein [Chitinophaga rhizosphaerae]
MRKNFIHQLADEGLLSETERLRLEAQSGSRLFSLHWELKTMLYLGVLLLSGGLGTLIYKNIDTIGHQAILAGIGLLCAACFWYANKHTAPFTWEKTESPNAWWDYVVLLGCLLFISFITYLQGQYEVFGTRLGSATFIPMVVLFFCAYYFDHLGVLSLAITNFAAWLGIAITPMHLLSSNAFGTERRLIDTALLIGLVLTAAGFASGRFNRKAHFSFTYYNFAVHVFCIGALCGMFFEDGMLLLYTPALAAALAFYYFLGVRLRSFYFLLMTVIYAYIGLGYLVIFMLILAMDSLEMGVLYLSILYLIVSSIAMARILIHLNRKLKSHADL